MSTMEKRLRFLALCNAAALCALGSLTLLAFTRQDRVRFTEVDVERLNIIGTNGQPVLVLANRRLIPGPSMSGKQYPAAVADGRDLVSGMIFFNEQGDEVGGLIFNGIPKDSGYSAVGHLSFDQWKQNQVVALQYIDGGTSRRAGLNVWDRPTDVTMDEQLDRGLRMMEATGAERDSLRAAAAAARARGEYGVQRLFVGSRDRTAQLVLRDTEGRVRVRLYVDSTDVARLEFLDESGRTVAAYPSDAR
ncbi:MAG: hypothetical protein JSU87_03325 [Gemmatimonadota bacterium]|nr:MAG: hypothetical protein JSU87_03325 [Gemmatimonadota bacterium]